MNNISRKGWLLGFALAFLVLMQSKHGYAYNYYSQDDFDIGLPIADCMKENNWEESSFQPESGYKLTRRDVGFTPSGVALIPAPVFDAIVECIKKTYGGLGIPSLGRYYKSDKTMYHVRLDLSNGAYVVRYLYANASPGIIRSSTYVYARTPDLPGNCDDVTDAISLKWCTGELEYNSNNPKNVFPCNHVHQEVCGKKYIRGTGGSYEAN